MPNVVMKYKFDPKIEENLLPGFNAGYTYDKEDETLENGLILRTILSDNLPTSIGINGNKAALIEVLECDARNCTSLWQSFYNCVNLERFKVIFGDKLWNLSHMLYNTPKLVYLDMSSCNFSNVTIATNIVQRGNNILAELILADSVWNDMNVQIIGHANGETLRKIILTNVDTTRVTSMRSLFNGKKLLKTADFSSFDTKNVTDMESMFLESGFTEVDLSSFNISKVIRFNDMFHNCRNLKKVKISNEKLPASNVDASLYRMFDQCSTIEELDLSTMRLMKITDIRNTFAGMTNLKKLNISGFKTTSNINCYHTFFGCPNLEVLDISNFELTDATSFENFLNPGTKLQHVGMMYCNPATVNKFLNLYRSQNGVQWQCSLDKFVYVPHSSGITPNKNIKLVTGESKVNTVTAKTDLVLRSIGSDKDELDARTGVITRRVYELVLDGKEDEVWITYASDDKYPDVVGFYLWLNPATYPSINFGRWKNYFGCLKLVTVTDPFPGKLTNNEEQIFLNSFGYLKLSVYKSRLTSPNAEGLKEWLKQNPITVQYVLKEPVTETVELTITDKTGKKLDKLATVNNKTYVKTKAGNGIITPTVKHANPSYKVCLKPNTQYSIIAKTDDNKHIGTEITYNLGGETVKTEMGARVTTVTTPTGTLGSNSLVMSGAGSKLSKIMVLEGDYTDKDVPFFTGMSSVKGPVVGTVGKNLLPQNYVQGRWNQWNSKIETSQSTITSSDYIDVTIYNENVTCSIKDGYKYQFSLYGSNKNQIYINDYWGHGFDSLQSFNFKTIAGSKGIVCFIRVNLIKKDGTVVTPNELGNIGFQMEYGTRTATEYESYLGNMVSAPQDLELCNLGALTDTLDLKTGKLSKKVGIARLATIPDEDFGDFSPNGVNSQTPNTANINIYKAKFNKHFPAYKPHTLTAVSNFVATKSMDTTYGKNYECFALHGDAYQSAQINLSHSRFNGELTKEKAIQIVKELDITIAYELKDVEERQVDLTSIDEERELISIKDGKIHVKSTGKNTLPPVVDYEIPTKNSYHMDLMRPNVDYTLKAEEATGTANMCDVEQEFELSKNKKFRLNSNKVNNLLKLNPESSWTKPMIIEGNLTDRKLPYFKGLQSVNDPKLTTMSKNLFDGIVFEKEYYIRLEKFENRDCVRIITRGTLESIFKFSKPIDCSKGVVISGMFKGGGYIILVPIYEDNTLGAELGGWWNSTLNWDKKAFAIPEGTKKLIGFTLSSSGNANACYIELKTLQVEYGTEATSYEAYKENTVKPAETLELRGIGDVRDTYDVSTGTLTQRIGVEVLNTSNENIRAGFKAAHHMNTSNLCAFDVQFGYNHHVSDDTMVTKELAKHHPSATQPTIANFYGKVFIIRIPKNEDGSNPTLDQFKEWLDKTNPTVYYKLPEPITKQVELSSYGNWDKMVLDGSTDENWKINYPNSTEEWLCVQIQNIVEPSLTLDTTQLLCDKMKVAYGHDWAKEEKVLVNGGNLNVLISKKKAADAEAFKQHLAKNPITVWYQTGTTVQDSNVKAMLAFKDGRVKVESDHEYSLQPKLSYEVPSKNSYYLDMVKQGKKYTLKADVADGGNLVHGTNMTSTKQVSKNELITFGSGGTELRNDGFVYTTGKVENMMLLDGDFTAINAPYFKGLQSAKNTKVVTMSKNLFDINSSNVSVRPAAGKTEYTITENTLSVKVLDATVNNHYVFFRGIAVKPNTKYTLSVGKRTRSHQDGHSFVNVMNGNNSSQIANSYLSNSESLTEMSTTFTTPANCTLLDFTFSASASNPILNAVSTYSDIMLEESDHKTDYVPYGVSEVSVPEEVGELSAVGDVKDMYDFRTGLHTKRIHKVVLDGTDDISLSFIGDTNADTDNTKYFTSTSKKLPKTLIDPSTIICSNAKIEPVAVVWSTQTPSISLGHKIANGYIDLRLNKADLVSPDTDGLIDYLKRNPLTIYMQLAKSETTKYESKELLAYDGGTIKTVSDSDVQPTYEYELPSYNSYRLNNCLPNNTLTKYTVFAKDNLTMDGDKRIKGRTAIEINPNSVEFMEFKAPQENMMVIQGDVMTESTLDNKAYFEGIMSATDAESTLTVESSAVYFDGLMELGDLDAGGNEVDSTSNVRTKNYIEAEPNATYVIKSTTYIGTAYVKNYNEKRGCIHSYGITIGQPFRTAANTRYIKFNTVVGSTDMSKDHKFTIESVENGKSVIELTSLPILASLSDKTNKNVAEAQLADGKLATKFTKQVEKISLNDYLDDTAIIGLIKNPAIYWTIEHPRLTELGINDANAQHMVASKLRVDDPSQRTEDNLIYISDNKVKVRINDCLTETALKEHLKALNITLMVSLQNPETTTSELENPLMGYKNGGITLKSPALKLDLDAETQYGSFKSFKFNKFAHKAGEKYTLQGLNATDSVLFTSQSIDDNGFLTVTDENMSINKPMVFLGDQRGTVIKKYFEGIKSVAPLSLAISNRNLNVNAKKGAAKVVSNTYLDKISVKANTTYTVSGLLATMDWKVDCYDAKDMLVETFNKASNSNTLKFTTGANVAKVSLVAYSNTLSAQQFKEVYDYHNRSVFMEEGDKVSLPHPYLETKGVDDIIATISNTTGVQSHFSSLKNGVVDELNVMTGIYTKRIAKMELVGTENWTLVDRNGDLGQYLFSLELTDAKSGGASDVKRLNASIPVVPVMETKNANQWPEWSAAFSDGSLHAGKVEVAIFVKDISTVEELKAKLAETNVYIEYELANPVTYVSQNLKTLVGDVNFVEGGHLRFNSETIPPTVEYKTQSHNYADVRTLTNASTYRFTGGGNVDSNTVVRVGSDNTKLQGTLNGTVNTGVTEDKIVHVKGLKDCGKIQMTEGNDNKSMASKALLGVGETEPLSVYTIGKNLIKEFRNFALLPEGAKLEDTVADFDSLITRNGVNYKINNTILTAGIGLCSEQQLARGTYCLSLKATKAEDFLVRVLVNGYPVINDRSNVAKKHQHSFNVAGHSSIVTIQLVSMNGLAEFGCVMLEKASQATDFESTVIDGYTLDAALGTLDRINDKYYDSVEIDSDNMVAYVTKRTKRVVLDGETAMKYYDFRPGQFECEIYARDFFPADEIGNGAVSVFDIPVVHNSGLELRKNGTLTGSNFFHVKYGKEQSKIFFVVNTEEITPCQENLPAFKAYMEQNPIELIIPAKEHTFTVDLRRINYRTHEKGMVHITTTDKSGNPVPMHHVEIISTK